MKRSYSGYLYIVLCAVIFSTMEVMLKTGYHSLYSCRRFICRIEYLSRQRDYVLTVSKR